MTLCTTPALGDGIAEGGSAERPWYVRLPSWISEARSHRVICLVLGIWLLNAFDLILTVLAHQLGVLVEQNPLAQRVLDLGTPSIVLFKVGCVLIGTYPLLRFRKARITELGSYVILFAYALLAVHWRECYEIYALTFTDHIHLAELGMILGTNR
jgi:hypothetical protein